jgi:hypothetical protein
MEENFTKVKLAAHRAGLPDSRDWKVSAKMQLPDRNVRPIGFLKSLHSSPSTRQGILQRFRKIIGMELKDGGLFVIF